MLDKERPEYLLGKLIDIGEYPDVHDLPRVSCCLWILPISRSISVYVNETI
jgi:hypothetical protein